MDHINRIKHDNRVENLRWVTPRENNLNSTRPKDIMTKEVYQMDLEGNIIKKWKSIRRAEDNFGIPHGKISMVCSGKRNTTGGYKWKYVEAPVLEGEIWEKYNERISVSNFGRVRKKDGYINQGHKTSIGYLAASVSPGRNKLVHSLVDELFIPNPNNLPVVNHIDEDKTNNNVKNLEWCTRGENTAHSIISGKNKRDHNKLSKKVIQFDKEGNKISEFCSIQEAHRITKITRSSIAGVCHGYNKQTNGFVFSFEDEKNKDSSHCEEKERKVKAVPLKGDGYIFHFNYVSHAAKFIGTTPDNISSVCKGKLPSSKGYVFSFED